MEGTMQENDELDFIPVFLINGFLEAGKTQFLQFTMQQEYFQTDGNTLLLLCEEGDTEYDEALLKRTHTSVIYMEDLSDMTPERLEELELLNNPERILIEWNGMWNMDALRLPPDWKIWQQVTVIDMSTFDLYTTNMKPLLSAMLKYSELVIGNRCDEIPDEKIISYRRSLKALCRSGQVILEDSEGEILESISEEDLPYDMKAAVVKIPADAYGIWYIDCMDKPQRYVGKTVEFTGMVLKSPNFPKNYFVPGRMAMTCCEDDMTFLGFVCKARNARKLETKQWVCVRARVELEYWQDYGGEGPVLYAESVEAAEAISEAVRF